MNIEIGGRGYYKGVNNHLVAFVSENILEKLNEVAYVPDLSDMVEKEKGILDSLALSPQVDTVDEFEEKKKKGAVILHYNKLEENKKLEPGDVFSYHGQLVYIQNKNTLAIIQSETGVRGLDRVIEAIRLEEMIRKDTSVDLATAANVGADVVPSNYKSSHCLKASELSVSEDFMTSALNIKETITMLQFRIESQEALLYPVTIYLDPASCSILYNPEDALEESSLSGLLLGAMGFIYRQNEAKSPSIQ